MNHIWKMGILFGCAIILISGVNTFVLPDAELQSLRTVKTSKRISQEDLTRWNKITAELIEKSKLEDEEPCRIYAYLYQAQNAFAEASYKVTGAYSGSLDPISFHVLRLFFPDIDSSGRWVKDSFSIELANHLAKQIDARFKEEQTSIHPLVVKDEKDLWHGKKPYYGIRMASMRPWILTKASEFRVVEPAAPEDPFWKDQAKQTKEKMNNATDSQKDRVLYWAGLNPKGSGNWLHIVQDYMTEHHTPLSKQLEVRAVIAATIVDAMIACFDTKYAYMIKRPFMIDPDLKPMIVTPNHPSFPSAHSTVAGALDVVLSYYFPENKKEWDFLAEESGQSRLWGGIHFPIDHQAGKELGIKIGQAILEKEHAHNAHI